MVNKNENKNENKKLQIDVFELENRANKRIENNILIWNNEKEVKATIKRTDKNKNDVAISKSCNVSDFVSVDTQNEVNELTELKSFLVSNMVIGLVRKKNKLLLESEYSINELEKIETE